MIVRALFDLILLHLSLKMVFRALLDLVLLHLSLKVVFRALFDGLRNDVNYGLVLIANLSISNGICGK
jgi:hypothetical protein